MTKLLLSLIVISLLGSSPALADDHTPLSCEEYSEVREIILETDWISQKEKDQLLKNIESFHGTSCVWPSFIP
jgi:hypothetical protein